ncbi:hypothetical protein ACHAWT_006206 [Skeletonema menzelii]
MVHHEQSIPTPTDETIFTHPPHFTSTNPFHRALSSFDLSLRCTICYNLYAVPVSLYPCLHTFCSLCVRKTFKSQYGSMKRKAECPTCNVVVGQDGNFDKAILPNHHLENMVQLYKDNVRGELVRSLQRLDVLERKERMLKTEGDDDGEGEEECGEQKQQAVSSVKRARRCTANYKREYSNENSDDEEEDATMTVNHSDDGGSSRIAATASTGAASALPCPPPATAAASKLQQRKRKPTPSYNHLKRKDLIALLSKCNLPTTGTDAELKRRHEEYILLYNSQCDSQHPMSEQEVIATVLREEKGRKRVRVEDMKSGASQHGVYMKRLGESLASSAAAESNGNGGGGNVVVATTGSKKVDGEMKHNFNSMIQKLKAKKKGGETSSSLAAAESEGDVPSCIAAAAAAVANGSGGDGGNNASKPRAKSMGNASASANTASAAAATVGATTMKATTSSSIGTITTTTTQPKSIINVSKQTSTTPAKKSRCATTTTTTKKQATISSSATKKKPVGIWKCPVCTFENHKYTTANALCEMCNNSRPEKENTSNEVISIDC